MPDLSTPPRPKVVDALVRVAGIDFTSRPTPVKAVTVALGRRIGTEVMLERIDAHHRYESFDDWLRTPGPWVAAFDFPFGLPRELVVALGWPREWRALMSHYAALSREEIRRAFAAFCAGRPIGGKFAHRGCDAAAGSSSPMKWVNPPVAYMLHAGVPRLLDAGLHLPHLHAGDISRVALEGYPGLLARELVGRQSYKSDSRDKQNGARRLAREAIVDGLVEGRSRLGLRLRLGTAEHAVLVADGTADRLDAVLCMMQAAWATSRPGYGLPGDLDPLEGWIVTTPVGPAATG